LIFDQLSNFWHISDQISIPFLESDERSLFDLPMIKAHFTPGYMVANKIDTADIQSSDFGREREEEEEETEKESKGKKKYNRRNMRKDRRKDNERANQKKNRKKQNRKG